MLVVDLLHEFELGGWKAVFRHLLRMLESVKENKLRELDRRNMILAHLCFQSFDCHLFADIARSLHLEEI
jgi:hypothetical protein